MAGSTDQLRAQLANKITIMAPEEGQILFQMRLGVA